MSQPTSEPTASTTAVVDPPKEGDRPPKRASSIPSPVLPRGEELVAVNGTKVPTTSSPSAATPASPPAPPAWSLRLGQNHHPAAPPAPPQRLSGRSLGPAGKRRSPLLVVLLSVVTAGVYALVWHQRVNQEMADFDPRMHARPGRSTLAVLIPWMLGVLVTLAAAARIGVAVAGVQLPFDPHLTVLQAYMALGAVLLIPYAVLLFPFSAIASAMTLERVRVVEDRVGVTTDVQLRPTSLLCVMLVPVFGGLAVLAVAQRRLNRVWQTAPATEARITRV